MSRHNWSNVASNQTLYQESFDIEYDRLLAVHEHVAAQVLSALHVSLSSDERERWESDRPRHALAYEFFLRGRDYYEASRYRHGIEFFEKSTALDPEFARAWAFLGSAYALNASLRLGGREHYDKAIVAYTKAIALNPADPRPHVQMADILIETNRVEEAVQVLRDVLQQHSRNAHAFWGLAYAYRYAGLLDQSAIAAERAGAIDPFLLMPPRSSYRQLKGRSRKREVGDAEGHYKLAQAYAVSHATQAAVRVLRKSIEGGFFCYPYVRNDPVMESVRREREYTVLLEQARQRHDPFKRRFF